MICANFFFHLYLKTCWFLFSHVANYFFSEKPTYDWFVFFVVLERGRWFRFEASEGKHATERASERWWYVRGMYMYSQILLRSDGENLFLFLCRFSDMVMYTTVCIFWFFTYFPCLYRKVRLKSQKCYIKSPCQTCVNYMGSNFEMPGVKFLNVSKFGHLKPLKLSLVMKLVIRQVILDNKGLFYNNWNC